MQGLANHRALPRACWCKAMAQDIFPQYMLDIQCLVTNAYAPAGKHLPITSADAAQQQQQPPAQQDSPEPGMGGLSSHLAAFTLDLNKFVRHSKLKVSAGRQRPTCSIIT